MDSSKPFELDCNNASISKKSIGDDETALMELPVWFIYSLARSLGYYINLARRFGKVFILIFPSFCMFWFMSVYVI